MRTHGDGFARGTQLSVNTAGDVIAPGNLGVGAAPTGFGRLDVRQGTNFRVLFSGHASYGSNAVVGINDSGVETHLGLAGTPIAFYVNAAEQMRLTSTGLGIGASSSQSGAKLFAQGDVVLQDVVASSGDPFPTLRFYNNNSTGFTNAGISATVGTTINSGNITFLTNNAGTYSEKMRLVS